MNAGMIIPGCMLAIVVGGFFIAAKMSKK